MEQDSSQEYPHSPTAILGLPGKRRRPGAAMVVSEETSGWEIYNDRASMIDRELIKDWNDSLNTLLIFAALYSAVLTAFIIESMKLLQEDDVGMMRDVLLVVTRQLANASVPALEPDQFIQPAFAVRVNFSFFFSISLSLVAALSAVLALQWVGSYDAGLNQSSPEERAIQRHFRYQGIQRWKMVQIINTLPGLIFLALFLFFIGLADWMWHIHQGIAAVIIAGLIFGASFFFVTTTISMVDVAAPFRTPASRSMPRVFTGIYCSFFALLPWTSAIKKFPGSHSGKGKPLFTWLLELLQALLLSLKSLGQYITSPYLVASFELREASCISHDGNIQISALSWLANSIDLSESSIHRFHILLKELSRIPDTKLLEWPSNNHEAPWNQIFKLLLPLRPPKDPSTTLQERATLPIAANVLQKMSFHPILLLKMTRVVNLRPNLLLAFLEGLKSGLPRDKAHARGQFEFLIRVLSYRRWANMTDEEQPVMLVFRIILNYLNVIQPDAADPGVTMSWIFTLCQIEKAKCQDGNVLGWPNPELLPHTPDIFTNQDLREHAMKHFLQYIDAVLSDSEPLGNTRWRWRWKSAAKSSPEDKLIIMEILIKHFSRIFFTFDESRGPLALFSNFLGLNKIRHPALKLVIIGFGGHCDEIFLPQMDDSIWNHKVWHYAISVWYGFQTDYLVCGGQTVMQSVPNKVSKKMIDALRVADPVYAADLIGLATKPRSPRSTKYWISLFVWFEGSERDISEALSKQSIGLYPEQWLEIFTHFEAPHTWPLGSSVKDAMLRTLQNTLRGALSRSLFQRVCKKAVMQDRGAPEIRQKQATGFSPVLSEILHREGRLRYTGSLLMGILELFLHNLLNANEDTVKSKVHASVCVIATLASTYTGASTPLQDGDYKQLFLEILQAIRPNQ